MTRLRWPQRWVSVVGWQLVSCPCAVAQTAPLTLPQVVDIALHRNPDVLQARFRVDSAQGERRIARAVPNPTYAGIPGNPYQYTIALPIDLTPERVYRTRAAKQGEEATEFDRRDVVRQVVFTVRQTFHDLLRADAQLQIAREQRDEAQAAPELTIPIESLVPMALATRADLAAARERLDQSQSLKSLATASLFPVPLVSAVYQRTPFESGQRYAFGVAVPVPLFYWNGGEQQRARAGVSAAEVAVQRARVQIEADVAVAVAGFRSARVLAERYQAGLLEKSAATLQTSRFAYGQGAISLLELLDAIRTYGDTRNEYYGAIHDYWVAAYGLSRAVGTNVMRE